MFKMASSPHTHSSNLTAKFMLWVMGAMLPALAMQCYYFGYGVLIQIAIALSLATVIELAVAKLRHKPTAYYLADLTGLVTAMMLAMAIPPYAPYWIIVIGTLAALLLAKHCYGGLGQNIFNPAMVGYALLLVSFPVQMTSWAVPVELLKHPLNFSDHLSLVFSGVTTQGIDLYQLISQVDGVSQATPLDSAKTFYASLCSDCNPDVAYYDLVKSPIFIKGSWDVAQGWWQVNVAFLLGGLVLLYKRIIHWQIPVAMLSVFTLCAFLTDMLLADVTSHLSFYAQLLSGAMMFGAFFIATDPVTASTTPQGKLIFGALIGLLLYIIRYYGNYPDAVAFSVLLANICVPLIDHYTQPRLYGTKLGKRR
ncbi:electron transport complex subunit RsxD [Phocoenobacter skyensis]|uniref:Ion-translocating oxidoreductase complex subunit D n=1 Tax=Phocoenobacter skyensis TaxID=97481 RepID=A0A1H7ZGB9_9PAST|nr:electron transport complex subunit RsxD [Pasteurella skyensis]MDP8079877.1 electron transport complex subunit RsxD [Pasteurella skyensis]MDP8085801.1 electron transport complex subunit RsxD [Pasteurella skyensis]MDP8185976.1 electron transport complex subunit RsxD [Pasteurella skyensis]QLB21887.1 electron transport complex subunit RsxD [Pasteurella skyensis]SEM57301.1 electron transport complex protein RnfD [Pasteurella skyensis]